MTIATPTPSPLRLGKNRNCCSVPAALAPVACAGPDCRSPKTDVAQEEAQGQRASTLDTISEIPRHRPPKPQ